MIPLDLKLEQTAATNTWSLFENRLTVAAPILAISESLGVILTLDVVDGALGCVQMSVSKSEGDKFVRSESIRRVPVGELVAHAMTLGAVISHQPLPPVNFWHDGPNLSALDGIAQVYCYCMGTGQKPTGILERDYGMSRPTASKWIAAAKRQGLIVSAHSRLEA